MSRIFEVSEHIEQVGDGQLKAHAPEGISAEPPDRRQSQRWSFDIPVYVYGHEPSTEPFHEEAHTLRVNANGALLLLSVPIEKGQELLLINTLTQQEQNCKVVFLGTRHSRTIEAGVAFPLTNPTFWQLPNSPKGKSAV